MKKQIILIATVFLMPLSIAAQGYRISFSSGIPSNWISPDYQKKDPGMASSWLERNFLPKYHHDPPISFGIGHEHHLTSHWRLRAELLLSTYLSECRRFGQVGKQQICYVGLPILLDYIIKLPSTKSEIYTSAGGQLEKGFYGYNGTDRLDADGWCWSLIGGIGVQIELQKRLFLFFEPTYTWTFHSPDTMDLDKNLIPYATCRSYVPHQLSIKIGFRKQIKHSL